MAVTFLTNEDETRILEETEAGKLLYTQQTLTDAQKAQARENIGAASQEDANSFRSRLADGSLSLTDYKTDEKHKLYASNGNLTMASGERAVTFLTNEDETRILEETEAGKLLYTQQTLTDAQKAQARENIGAVSAQEVLLIGKKTYKQIATITVVPNADGSLPQHVIFTADSEGNPFELTDFMVKAYAGFVDGSTSSLNVAVNGTNAISGSAIPSISTELRGFNVFFRQESDSFVRAEHTVSVGNAIVYNPAGRIAASFLIPTMSEYGYMPVSKVDLFTQAGTTKAWVEGSTFELWGVQA